MKKVMAMKMMSFFLSGPKIFSPHFSTRPKENRLDFVLLVSFFFLSSHSRTRFMERLDRNQRREKNLPKKNAINNGSQREREREKRFIINQSVFITVQIYSMFCWYSLLFWSKFSIKTKAQKKEKKKNKHFFSKPKLFAQTMQNESSKLNN